MTQQINYNTLEQYTFSPARKMLEKPLKNSTRKENALPEDFLQELDAYIERNHIVKSSSANLKGTHCPQCLKAHTLELAKKHDLHESIVQQLVKSLPGKIGHDGYYLDGKELISLTNE